MTRSRSTSSFLAAAVSALMVHLVHGHSADLSSFQALRQHLGGPRLPKRWASKFLEVANRDLGRTAAPAAVLRNVLDHEERSELIAIYERELAAGREEPWMFATEAFLPSDHPLAVKVRAAVRAALPGGPDVAAGVAHHDLAAIRRYISPAPGNRPHCDNGEQHPTPSSNKVCPLSSEPCRAWLKAHNICRRNRHLNHNPDSRALRRLLDDTLPANSSCRGMPLRCFSLACEKWQFWSSALFQDGPPGCGTGRLPVPHAPFRAFSLTLNLDNGYSGGEPFFLDREAEEAWSGAVDRQPGDAVLWGANTLHATAPLLSGSRTVLLYWFHVEPWGAGEAGEKLQRAYEDHVTGLTNYLYPQVKVPEAWRRERNFALKSRLYRDLRRYCNASSSGSAEGMFEAREAGCFGS